MRLTWVHLGLQQTAGLEANRRSSLKGLRGHLEKPEKDLAPLRRSLGQDKAGVILAESILGQSSSSQPVSCCFPALAWLQEPIKRAV